ncbi:hypothetical protein Pmani_037864 [Petrolisthes manimaculis]|uniref:Uncharacterized protein n=1 Tax=Petrolisthes manimaculis TaxID=1843537 RepID=A0AAE1TL16_9EUCA|nr:hypothetical protein Pmani_037864 [Petrolisthes manimaculis]
MRLVMVVWPAYLTSTCVSSVASTSGPQEGHIRTRGFQLEHDWKEQANVHTTTNNHESLKKLKQDWKEHINGRRTANTSWLSKKLKQDWKEHSIAHTTTNNHEPSTKLETDNHTELIKEEIIFFSSYLFIFVPF